MAEATKNTKPAETVEVPVSVLQQLQSRLEQLERESKVRAELAINPRAMILDPEYEAYKLEMGRPAKDRTQDIADKRYGKDGKRFLVKLDSTTDEGKPGPNVSEHFELTLSANSDIEAKGRYLELMGIRKHDYRVIATPTAA